jgi:prepilin-type N-terminal cleavage/methylation domain-containing protein
MNEAVRMRTRLSPLRRAFTLVEILVSLGILGIIGLAFVRLLTSQARFTEGQMALRNARTVSRNAMNIMLTDLRMVEDNGGLQIASRDSVTVRIPIAFGLLCSNVGGDATMQLLPVDSAMTEFGYYSGWAYRDSVSGLFAYQNANTPIRLGDPSLSNGVPPTTCTDSTLSGIPPVQKPGILPMSYTTPTGAVRSTRIIRVTDPVTAVTPTPGWPVFVYQQITYRFQASSAYPGRIGLFRKVRAPNPGGAVIDEIIAPFDTSAKFRFYVLNADVAQDAPPADLNTVRGLELNLAGSSPRAQQGKKEAVDGLVTAVFFKNRRDP